MAVPHAKLNISNRRSNCGAIIPRVMHLQLGVFFWPLAVLLLTLSQSSCEEKSTPSWPSAEQETPAPAGPASTNDAQQSAEIAGEEIFPADGLRVLSYNLRHFLCAENDASREQEIPVKSAAQIELIADIIAGAQPHVLGVCEMGSEKDLKRLQLELAKRGQPMPFSHMHYGRDAVRHLAMLSKFPIHPHHYDQKTSFQLDGRRFEMSRGLLHASIHFESGPVHFLGLHLKSMRPVDYADQAALRRHEAELARTYIDAQFKQNPDIQLVVHGDLNDHRNSAAVHALCSSGEKSSQLTPLSISDADGQRWTHYWKLQDHYSRLDYFLLSAKLQKHFSCKHSQILSPKSWYFASDHRPLLLVMKNK